jgi:hypothetical protein
MSRFIGPGVTLGIGLGLIVTALVAFTPGAAITPQSDDLALVTETASPGSLLPPGQLRANELSRQARAGLLTPWPTHVWPTRQPGTVVDPPTYQAGEGDVGYNVVLPFPSGMYMFTNYWRSDDEPVVSVAAGRNGWAIDPRQGVLLVDVFEGTSNARLKSLVVRPLAKTGALEIIGASGRTLHIVAADGTSFLFNVDDLTLRDLAGSIVPTQTPRPER